LQNWRYEEDPWKRLDHRQLVLADFSIKSFDRLSLKCYGTAHGDHAATHGDNADEI
jgi:hypothetical protein